MKIEEDMSSRKIMTAKRPSQKKKQGKKKENKNLLSKYFKENSQEEW